MKFFCLFTSLITFSIMSWTDFFFNLFRSFLKKLFCFFIKEKTKSLNLTYKSDKNNLFFRSRFIKNNYLRQIVIRIRIRSYIYHLNKREKSKFRIISPYPYPWGEFSVFFSIKCLDFIICLRQRIFEEMTVNQIKQIQINADDIFLQYIESAQIQDDHVR